MLHVRPDSPGIGRSAGEHVERHEFQVRVGVYRAVALVEHHHGGATRRRLVAEAVADLGDDRGPGQARRLGQGLHEETIVQAELTRHAAAIDQ